MELAARLGIGMGPSGGPRLAEGERKTFHEVRDELRRFVWGQVQKPEDALEAPPPGLAGYLAAHAAHLESLRIHVLQHEVPLWAMDVARLRQAPTPNVDGHRTLQEVMVLAALEAARRGQAREASEALEESSRSLPLRYTAGRERS